jgi:hypothetical protein
MLFVSIFTMKTFGLPGFMVTWIAWEVIQTTFVVRLNVKLFPSEVKVSMEPLVRLAIFMGLAFALAAWPAYHELNWPLPIAVAVALTVIAVLGGTAYFAFGLGEVHTLVEGRFRGVSLRTVRILIIHL